ncbi:N-acetylmuramoyl-L-alanine amidase [Streptomyces luteogriseus]|uniref:peptidoglycan recognition protein family protein n=1 Tax=Streptomyces luteogriseus TaxID=68233 RepID=UPI0037F60778
MAWYPGAKKMELQPESDAQPAIRPTQLIVHSVVAPWDEQRIYAYWRDSTSLESHFGLDYDGSIGQYIGTETRADANAGANRRPDGTGAVSIETASNTKASDAWTPEQIEQLVRLGVWLHQRHGIPLRICRSHSDPGFGYHSMFSQWSTSGTACPGAARIRQFKEVVFPAIVARATGKTEPPKETNMALTDDDIKKIWHGDHIPAVPPPYNNADWADGNETWTAKYALGTVAAAGRETLDRVKKIEAQVDSLTVGGVDLDALAEKVADLLAARLAQ